VTGDAELRAALGELDRRGFLRLAGAAVGLAVAPLGCRGAAADLAPPAEANLAVLDARSYAVFTAAAAGLIGGPGGEWILSGRVQTALAADAWLARVPGLGELLTQGLLVLEFAPWPLLPKLRPFTELAPAGRATVLRDLMTSRFDWKRDLFKGLKSLAVTTFYADPASRLLVRYPGPFGGAEATIADAMTYDPGR
jgi:hypothetical protein